MDAPAPLPLRVGQLLVRPVRGAEGDCHRRAFAEIVARGDTVLARRIFGNAPAGGRTQPRPEPNDVAACRRGETAACDRWIRLAP